MMSKYFLIYITFNLINGKKYIGSHITEDKNDNYLGSGIYLKKAIKKYGIHNFKKEIIHEASDSIDMKLKEEYYINLYDAYYSKDYYNATKYSKGITHFPEDKIQNIVKANKNNKYNLGKKHSEKTKQKISENNKNKIRSQKHKAAIGNSVKGTKYNLGKKMSDETKMKISQKKKGHICYKNEERNRKISLSNKGKSKYIITDEIRSKMIKSKNKAIIQYDLYGNVICEHESIKQAALYLGKKQATRIIEVCKNRKKQAFGYIWKYKNT